MPTRLWKAATSCGIAVIWILRAVTRPMPPPITIATKISPDFRAINPSRAVATAIGRYANSGNDVSVVTTAIAMPIMPV